MHSIKFVVLISVTVALTTVVLGQEYYEWPLSIEENGHRVVMHAWTNISEDSTLKFLIDTGAAFSMIASDLVQPEEFSWAQQLSLYGILGNEAKVQTGGHATITIVLHGNLIHPWMQIVDRSAVLGYDGFLGYWDLLRYKATIDLQSNKVLFELPKYGYY